MLPIPPVVRQWLPPLVLGLGAFTALSTAIQLYLSFPDWPLLALPFLGSAGVLALGAWGAHREAFWARGFALGALVSSGVGGIWLGGGLGVALPAGLISILILLEGEAPGRFEQRASFRRRTGLSRDGAKRLFLMALGLGLGLPALLGSPLAIVLFATAPVPAAVAAGLGLAALVGLTRLASWSFFAALGALVALVVAIAASAAAGRGIEVTSSGLGVAGLALALAPLVRPVFAALRRPPSIAAR